MAGAIASPEAAGSVGASSAPPTAAARTAPPTRQSRRPDFPRIMAVLLLLSGCPLRRKVLRSIYPYGVRWSRRRTGGGHRRAFTLARARKAARSPLSAEKIERTALRLIEAEGL